MQAAVRDKEQEIRRLQAASGGASEAEMAAAVAAKEAALKAAAQLQAVRLNYYDLVCIYLNARYQQIK